MFRKFVSPFLEIHTSRYNSTLKQINPTICKVIKFENQAPRVIVCVDGINLAATQYGLPQLSAMRAHIK